MTDTEIARKEAELRDLRKKLDHHTLEAARIRDDRARVARELVDAGASKQHVADLAGITRPAMFKVLAGR